MKYETAQKVFATLAGGTFVGLDSETKVPLAGGKKNPQQGRVTKQMFGATVMCFSNSNSNAYNNMVKRRLAAEGKDPEKFQLSPRVWGTRILETCFVEHNGKHYLEVIFLRPGPIQYLLDGRPIDESDIIGLKDSPEPTGQAGLENQVIIRTFALESVTALRANGAEWH